MIMIILKYLTIKGWYNMTEREKLTHFVQMEIKRANLFSSDNLDEEGKMFIDEIIVLFSMTIKQKEYKIIEEEVNKQIEKLDDKRNKSFIIDGIYEMLRRNE